MHRHNFSQDVIRKLRERVAHRCSNPDCRVPTVGPGDGESGVSSIGVAAHITAAAPGGPRYDSNCDMQTRKSIRNGIWLCAKCSIEIDREVQSHPIELLKAWKAKAESQARAERGKRLAAASDATDTVAMALAGLPTKFLPKAIANVHVATAQTLEALDPRFSVETSHTSGKSSFLIRPKIPTTLAFLVHEDYEPNLDKKWDALANFGEKMELDGRSVSVDGSKLFQEILTNAEKVTVSQVPRDAVHKMWALDPTTGERYQFEDARGALRVARKQIAFEGSACAEMFQFSYVKPTGAGQKSATVRLGVNMLAWDGKDVRALPYFRPMVEFFSRLSRGWKFCTSLVVEGHELLTSAPIDVVGNEVVHDVAPLLGYAKAASKLAAFLDETILFRPKLSFSAEEYENLLLVAEMTKVDGYKFNSISGDISMTLHVTNAEQMRVHGMEKAFPASYRFEEPEKTLVVFGQTVHLPRKITYVGPVVSIVGNLSSVKDGDDIEVILRPETGFTGIMQFVKEGLNNSNARAA